MRQWVAITIVLCAGCSSVDSTTTGAEIERACSGFITHTQIETLITTYEALRDLGFSKADGLVAGTEICLAPPIPPGFDFQQCVFCNTAIVDFVWDQ